MNHPLHKQFFHKEPCGQLHQSPSDFHKGQHRSFHRVLEEMLSYARQIPQSVRITKTVATCPGYSPSDGLSDVKKTLGEKIVECS